MGEIGVWDVSKKKTNKKRVMRPRPSAVTRGVGRKPISRTVSDDAKAGNKGRFGR